MNFQKDDVIVSKLRIINLIVIRLIVQFFDQIYYNSINESNNKDLNQARYYFIIIEKKN